MRAFKDNAGRSWTVAVNVATIKRVRALTSLDLLDVAGGAFEKLVGDPVILCDVLYAICKPDADAIGVTDEQFGAAMAGDAIEHASRALIEDLIQFFPNPRERAALSRVVEAMDAAMDKARTQVQARLDSGEIDRSLEKALMATSGSTTGPSSTDSPASSESILTD